MFSHRPDASKVALAALVAACRARGVPLIDCQQNTGHLASLGAREVPRDAFEAHLVRTLGEPGVGDWTYDETHWRGLLPD
jgi:leucyl/phenylalanyl-tRNA--protein transferase